MYAPVVDFAACGLLRGDAEVENKSLNDAGSELSKAFTTSGFAYLSNTGVDMAKVDELHRVAEQFFNKDLTYKDQFSNNDVAFGYDKMGSTRANPGRPYDHQEGFHITSDALTDRPVQWPDVPLFEKTIKELADVCRQLSKRLLRALGEGMKLKDAGILERSHSLLNREGNHTSMRIISYPGITSQEVLSKQCRVGEHSDWGTITLLFQDDVGGLQIKTADGAFVDVPPIPGTIVINVGDMLSIWSQNKLRSSVHRVIIPDDPELRRRTRKSIAYFVNADDDTVLSNLECQEIEKFSLHKTLVQLDEHMTAGNYIKMRNLQYFGLGTE